MMRFMDLKRKNDLKKTSQIRILFSCSISTGAAHRLMMQILVPLQVIIMKSRDKTFHPTQEACHTYLSTALRLVYENLESKSSCIPSTRAGTEARAASPSFTLRAQSGEIVSDIALLIGLSETRTEDRAYGLWVLWHCACYMKYRSALLCWVL